MSDSHDARDANRLAALALALVDGMREATEEVAGHAAAGPAALVALDEFLGGRSMDDLRRALGLTPSGAVRLVDRLAADGCVNRRPGTDGRSVSLVLTAKGRRLARRVQAARLQSIEAALSSLRSADRQALIRATDALLEAVTTERLSARRAGAEPLGGWLCRLCDFAACGRDEGDCPTLGAVRDEVR